MKLARWGLAAMASTCLITPAVAQDSKSVTVVLTEVLDVIEPCMAARSDVGRVVLQNINETLTEFVPGQAELQPRLATSWEQVNDATWRFKLREGVKFHDGSALDPADVTFSIDRNKNAGLGCETGGKYFGGMTFTTTAVDDTTIEITTDPASPILPLLLSVLPIQPDSDPADTFTTSPVGTGPYKLVSWDVGQSLKVERSADYWGEQPIVDGATYLFRTDAAVAAAMITTGEADIAPNIAVQDATNPDTDFSYPNSETSTLRIDGLLPPFDDRRVREALNLAIDRDAMIGTIFAPGVEKATQQVPPTTIGFAHDLKPWPYDLERARALLAEAKADGVPVDTEIEMIGRINIYPNATEVMEGIQAMLIEAGFNAKLQMYDVGEWNRYFVKPYPEPRAPNLVQAQHDNAKGDPVFTAFVKHHSEGVHSAMSDPEVDGLIEKATLASGEDRQLLWEQMFTRVNDTVIADIPLFYMVGFSRVGPRLDFKPTIATNSELQLSQIKFR
ncbi:ABC transporter substrate-binding protein [Methylobrevis albus]|uniref:Peptide ABC transporter substrate-binding protein n=1 Tax=Methylobrevis albus TaxID=2793297 RepID=A0A931I565_9HYPH|nr:ABC transporter substrate-binding protein [Methylobrevis albus]MBH0239478.1 peptide ABC transporter substrate-binding protein [Methylobrevis albus]